MNARVVKKRRARMAIRGDGSNREDYAFASAALSGLSEILRESVHPTVLACLLHFDSGWGGAGAPLGLAHFTRAEAQEAVLGRKDVP